MSKVLLCMILGGSLTSGGVEEVFHTPTTRAECAMSLIEIGKRLQLFAARRQGMHPSKLSELVTEGTPSAGQYLACPGALPNVVTGGFYSSYAYLAVVPDGRKLDTKQQEMLAFDATPVHENGRNVLYSNMAVDYLKEPDFQKRLAAEQERYRKQGKKLEVVQLDFVPLADGQLLNLERDAGSFFDSVHVKITLAILLGIGLVLVLLLAVVQRRKSGEA